MPVNDIYELSEDQAIGANQITNVHYFKQLDSDGPVDPRLELSTAFLDDVVPAQLAIQGTDLFVNDIRVRRVDPIETQTLWHPVSTPGIRVGETMTCNIVAQVAWYSEPASPVRVGRTFLSGIVEEDVYQGLLLDALRTLLITFVDVLKEDIEGPNAVKFRKVLYRTVDQTFEEVLSGQVRMQTKKLGSRTIGVGQ